ncbi:MAG: outer membrane protein assembly factor BamD [Gammaproteobacteria bacterium]|nr:outer membrane protein assembly factor BamD [Gammaproteobacteria bacterium]
MHTHSLHTLLLLLLSLLIGACATTPEDETAGWTAQQFYDKAKDALVAEDYHSAILLYSKLEARYPYGRYAQQAQLETAYAHYKAEDPYAAIASAERFIQLYPRHNDIDYAYYLRGLASYDLDPGFFEKLGGQDRSERDPQRARESFNYFKQLVTRFPESRYKPDSIERMKKLRNSLARYEIHVADYYLRRGAYIAAINRAKYVVENYRQTPSVPDALKIMVRGYRQLDMKGLADDTLRVLELNHPGAMVNESALSSLLPELPLSTGERDDEGTIQPPRLSPRSESESPAPPL